jgi:lipopolysaccharide exporter
MKRINNIFQKYISPLKTSKFIKNTLSLFSGSFVSQLIFLVFTPLITRIFSPSEMGEYAVFLSLSTIITIFSALRFEDAILLANSKRDSQSLAIISLISSIFFIILFFLFIFFLGEKITQILNINSKILFLICISGFVLSLRQILINLLMKNNDFSRVAINKAQNALGINSMQYFSKSILDFSMLSLSKVIIDTISLIPLFFTYFSKNSIQLKDFLYFKLKKIVKIYRNFPLYNLPSSLINNISQNLPLLFISTFYSLELAGFFSLATRVLRLPVDLVSNSVRKVYYIEASNLQENKLEMFSLYKKVTGILFIIFIPIFLIIFFAGEEIFSIILGNVWSKSGQISRILILWFLMLFINAPSIVSFNILGKQKVLFYFEIISLLTRFLALYSGYYFYNSFEYSLLLFTAGSVIINLLIIIYIYNQLRR